MSENINIIPQKKGITELIEKSVSQYSDRETMLVNRIYPECKDKSKSELVDTLTVNGKQLSVYEISMLHSFFPDESLNGVKIFLSDEKKQKEYIDSVASSSGLVKNRFWKLFSTLPLSLEVEIYIVDKFVDKKINGDEVVEKKEEKEIIAETNLLVRLPFGSIPHVETYLASLSRDKKFKMPQAILYYFDQDNNLKTKQLSNQETSAACIYLEERRKYVNDLIEKNREKYEDIYKKELGLPQSAKIEGRELKEFFLKKSIKHRLFEFAQEKTDMHNISDVEIRLTTHKKGLSEEFKKIISSGEYLSEHFEYLIDEKKRKNNQEKDEELKTPGMINFGEKFGEFLSLDAFNFEEGTSGEKKHNHVFSMRKSVELTLNELQRAYLDITRATKSGDWEKATRLYVKYMDCLPQYLEHRMGVLDIYNKYREGKIKVLPRRVLSVASGPHEELRAQFDASRIINDYKIPEVTSLDAYDKMLLHSRENMPDEIKTSGLDVVADMRLVPIKDKSIDMIECSSFDNLKDEDEIKSMIFQMAQLIKIDGVFRFMIGQPFSEDFCRTLENNNISILEKNSRPVLSKKIEEEIIEKRGDEFGKEIIDRIKYKIKRHCYFLARVDDEIDVDKLKKDLEDVKLFSSRERASASSVQKDIKRQKDAKEKQIDENIFNYNSLLIVAKSPSFFLNRKSFKEEYLEFALTELRNNIDLKDALYIFQVYLNNPELNRFLHLALNLIINNPEAKRYLQVDLLNNENEKVQDIFEKYLLLNIEDYVLAIINSNISQENKKNILTKVNYGNNLLDKISNYISSVDDGELIKLVYIFEYLPKNCKIKLPVTMRFISQLKKTYFEYAKGDILEGDYSDNELVEIFEKVDDNKLLLELVGRAIKVSLKIENKALAKRILGVILESDKLVVGILINQTLDEIEKLLNFLEQDASSQLLLNIQSFKKEFLNISIDKSEREEVLAVEFQKRYKKIFDTFFQQRKRIDKEKENYIEEIRKMLDVFSKEFLISEINLLYLIVEKKDQLGSTPKGREMDEIFMDLIVNEISKKIENWQNLDDDSKVDLLRGDLICGGFRGVKRLTSHDRLNNLNDMYDNYQIFNSKKFEDMITAEPDLLNKGWYHFQNQYLPEKLRKNKDTYGAVNIYLYNLLASNIENINSAKILKKLCLISELDYQGKVNCIERLKDLTDLSEDEVFMKKIIAQDPEISYKYKDLIISQDLLQELQAKLFINGKIDLSENDIDQLLNSDRFDKIEIIKKCIGKRFDLVKDRIKDFSISEQKEILLLTCQDKEAQKKVIDYIADRLDLKTDRNFLINIAANNLKEALTLMAGFEENEVRIVIEKNLLSSNFKQEDVYALFELHPFLYKEYDLIRIIERKDALFSWKFIEKLDNDGKKEFFEKKFSDSWGYYRYNYSEKNIACAIEVIEKNPEFLQSSEVISYLVAGKEGMDYIEKKFSDLGDERKIIYHKQYIRSSFISLDKKITYLKENEYLFENEEILEYLTKINDKNLQLSYLFTKYSKEKKQEALLNLISRQNIDIYEIMKIYKDFFINKDSNDDTSAKLDKIVMSGIASSPGVIQELISEKSTTGNDVIIERFIEFNFKLVLPYVDELNVNQKTILLIKIIPFFDYVDYAKKIIISGPEVLNDKKCADLTALRMPEIFMQYAKQKTQDQIDLANQKMEEAKKEFGDSVIGVIRSISEGSKYGKFQEGINPKNSFSQLERNFREGGVRHKDIIDRDFVLASEGYYLYETKMHLVDNEKMKIRIVTPIKNLDKKIIDIIEGRDDTALLELIDSEIKSGKENIRKISQELDKIPKNRRMHYVKKVEDIVKEPVASIHKEAKINKLINIRRKNNKIYSVFREIIGEK